MSLLLCVAPIGCAPQSSSPPPGESQRPTSEAAIRRFCGDCHAFPEPDTYPHHAWPEKVREGFNFYYASLRSDLEVPAVDAVEQFYLERAPEHLDVPTSDLPAATDAASLFAASELLQPDEALQAVAHLAVEADGLGESPGLLLCDMGTGNVWQMLLGADPAPLELIAHCRNPCHIAPSDLDADTRRDFVVADLGTFLPEDHDLGAVWWLRPNDADGWDAELLADGLGRVADVRPVDVEGDGDQDLIVAEFGWHQSGRILLLRQRDNEQEVPKFDVEVLDERHGTINVCVTELNGDAHPDFVALIAQEFETVEAFLGRGDGTFDREALFRSDNPGFGCSRIDLADVEGDGDTDVLLVNGDSLDTPIAKPYHSLRWLENTGSFPFIDHEITRLPGAHCVRAGDLDGDGDLDLAAVSLLPGAALADHQPGTFDSIAWFEQTSPGVFAGQSLERDNCHHAACSLADWDTDGDLDLIVADLSPDPTAKRPLTIFRNRTIETVADRNR